MAGRTLANQANTTEPSICGVDVAFDHFTQGCGSEFVAVAVVVAVFAVGEA